MRASLLFLVLGVSPACISGSDVFSTSLEATESAAEGQGAQAAADPSPPAPGMFAALAGALADGQLRVSSEMVASQSIVQASKGVRITDGSARAIRDELRDVLLRSAAESREHMLALGASDDVAFSAAISPLYGLSLKTSQDWTDLAVDAPELQHGGSGAGPSRLRRPTPSESSHPVVLEDLDLEELDVLRVAPDGYGGNVVAAKDRSERVLLFRSYGPPRSPQEWILGAEEPVVLEDCHSVRDLVLVEALGDWVAVLDPTGDAVFLACLSSGIATRFLDDIEGAKYLYYRGRDGLLLADEYRDRMGPRTYALVVSSVSEHTFTAAPHLAKSFVAVDFEGDGVVDLTF